MAKLLKLRRGNTSQHGSFTGAEGEVTVDTTKDTLVVHDGSTAGGHPVAAEDMANVSAADIKGRLGTTLTNAEINASAAIAGTKISPDFGSQNITTTGNVTATGTITSGDVTITDSNPKLVFTDTDSNPDFSIFASQGEFQIYDETSTTTRFKVNSDGHTDVFGNLDVSSGVDVTGNITVSGTVDGRDVAQDGGKIDELYGTSNTIKNTVNLADGVTATTQAQSDDSTKVSTTAYVRTAVANVVNSAPAALDTLNELAAALGDDANFATTTSTSIGTKLSKSGGEMTGNITFSGSQTVDGRDLSVDGAKLDGIQAGATDDQSASEILTAIKTVDGSGSGLDADLIDGHHSTQLLKSDAADTADGDITFNGGAGAVTVAAGSDIRINGGTWTGEYNTGIKLQPDGNNSYFQYEGSLYFRNTSGSNKLTLDQSGNLTATGNVTAYSDAILKKDISTINGALDICGKLRGVSYKWKGNDKKAIGVIAQEVEKVLPEVVLTNKSIDPETQEIKKIKSVDYGKIVGVLINAINELKAELDEHKKGGA